MVSPIFDIDTHSSWQLHVREIWKYLVDNYELRNSDNRYTTIHVCFSPKYNLTELQRIACSIIHFETAFEALQPENIHDAERALSHWLHIPSFAQSPRSRSASIDYIEQPYQIYRDLLRVLQGNSDPVYGGELYAWNFYGVDKGGMIEFRKPPGCLPPTQVFSWAELTMTFILASMRYGSSANLSAFSHDIGGLKEFVSQVDIPGGVGTPHYLHRMWEGKNLKAAREPIMLKTHFDIADSYNPEPAEIYEEWMTIKKMIEYDARECNAIVPQHLRNHLSGFDTTA